ncbi:MAG: hypothetical protein LLG14_23510 [Nocardiaceae bacterium]|nr:hypothetical protein [Nocardiaceae bacterium]
MAGLGCATAALTYIQCVDAAHEAVRAAARGADAPATEGMRVEIATVGDTVRATATADAGLLPLVLHATAEAALEPGAS